MSAPSCFLDVRHRQTRRAPVPRPGPTPEPSPHPQIRRAAKPRPVAGGRPTPGEPTRRLQAIHAPTRLATSDAASLNPQRPTPQIQVGASSRASPEARGIQATVIPTGRRVLFGCEDRFLEPGAMTASAPVDGSTTKMSPNWFRTTSQSPMAKLTNTMAPGNVRRIGVLVNPGKPRTAHPHKCTVGSKAALTGFTHPP